VIPFEETAAVLITKDKTYPSTVLDHVRSFPFGLIFIATQCDGPGDRYIQMCYNVSDYHNYMYFQDDDAICPIRSLMEQATPGVLTCAMKPRSLEEYKDTKACLVGWGAVADSQMVLKFLGGNWIMEFGSDVFCREADRIFTYVNYPQRRLDLPIIDLPYATSKDRLSMQPNHHKTRDEVLRRLDEICG